MKLKIYSIGAAARCALGCSDTAARTPQAAPESWAFRRPSSSSSSSSSSSEAAAAAYGRNPGEGVQGPGNATEASGAGFARRGRGKRLRFRRRRLLAEEGCATGGRRGRVRWPHG